MKKVLIITYYWPPAGGPGVQRWLKFVKYLPDFGVEPIVYIPENPHYPITDNTLQVELPKGITILKHPIREPFKFANLLSKKSAKSISTGVIPRKNKQSLIEKLMLYVRGNFFIPDARKAWVNPSVKFLSRYIEENGITTIITTGPPHSLHLIGLGLKKENNLKWLADFRDPWTTIGYHKKLKLTRSSVLKHKELESSVLHGADQILVTSNVTKNEFQAITNKPIEVITNGYDMEVPGIVSLDEKFTISHIGSLLSERNPQVLWEVLSDLVSENASFSDSFQLKLIGTVSEEVLDSISKNRLKHYTKFIGYVSHNEAIKHQRQSQILLLIEINSEETKCIIPGKLFEYMVSKRPILAIGPEGSDIEYIISETETGTYFGYSDKEFLKSTIMSYFDLYKQGTLQSDPTNIEKYSRRALTRSLAQLI